MKFQNYGHRLEPGFRLQRWLSDRSAARKRSKPRLNRIHPGQVPSLEVCVVGSFEVACASWTNSCRARFHAPWTWAVSVASPTKKPRNRRGGSVADLESGYGGRDQASRSTMLATILRTWEAFEARGLRMARLFSNEPHLRTLMVTWRVPQRFMALKEGL